MKIFYVANIRIPTEKAHGLQIMKMCEAFSNLGHEVVLLVPNRKNSLIDNPFLYYGIEENFKIKKIPILDTVNFGKWGFVFESILFSIMSSFYLFFKKVDLIYTRDEYPALVSLFLFRKVLWESHTGAYNVVAKFVIKASKKIIVISEGLKRFYVGKGVSEKKIVVAGDAVDMAEFSISESKEECREKLNLPKDKKIVLYTGHLYDWKGVDTLAQSAKQFDTDVEFVFVGGTEKDIKSFKEKYGSILNIKILGQKPHDDIPYYLKSADLLVIPNSAESQVSREFTSPMKLFEYMASKTPFIASNIPSIKDIVGENVDIFFEPDNNEDLAKKIHQSLLKEQTHNFSDILKNSSWESRAENILNN